MLNKDCHIAQLQELCGRVLSILEEENFFESTRDGEFWYSSIFNDLTKAREGVELKTFRLTQIKLLGLLNERASIPVTDN